MITIEDFSTTATSQTVKVWYDDDDYVTVDIEIEHDYEEVTKVDVDVYVCDQALSAELMAEIKGAVIDHVEQYFEVPEWEDDPDRVYERRNDK
ncbi:MAG: hypothetical protein E6Q97_35850 [Desulfurellales bacterium]|nr:MAG: hypothetical protein E6Q97_35850 [Desulfurellales bacterium]